MAGQLRQWDIGSIIRVKVIENGAVFNASAVQASTLKLKRPSGYVLEVPCTFESDGADGVFIYETVKGDLSETGPWSGQVFMVFQTGSWHTDTFSFQVGENLSAPKTDEGGGVPSLSDYQARVLADGAIAYWPLDESAGSTMFRDLAGARTGIAQTLNGGAVLPGEPGVVAGTTATRFVVPHDENGNPAGSGWIVVPAGVPASPGGLTVELWGNCDPLGFGSAGGSGQPPMLCHMRAMNGESQGYGVVAFQIEDQIDWAAAPPVSRGVYERVALSNPFYSDTPMGMGAWHHWVAVWDGTSSLLYRDGVEAGRLLNDDPIQPDYSSGVYETYIGSYDGSEYDNGFLGLLQDVAYYPRPLTPAEVLAHFALRTAASVRVATNLAANRRVKEATT